MKSRKRWVAGALPVALVLALSLMADKGRNHQAAQTPPIELGTSGGNVQDINTQFCCSGTLGALVERGGQRYILSNNHVLARGSQAANGEDVSQPGLIDVGCNVNNTTIVADFSEAPPLGGATNVDAALAAERSGGVDANGSIIDIGVPSSALATPALNMQVAKSGRTTGFSCGSIASVSTDVSVQYQQGCGIGNTFMVTYTDQLVITGRFSAGGDSGSLIVQASTARPVGLLFAGSSSTTIGNPIQDVVAALNGITFVGGGDHAVACKGGGGNGGGPPKGKNASAGATGQQARVSVEQALAAKRQYARGLMQDPAVMGVGVGIDDDGEPVVVIYVEEGRPHRPLPQMTAGVRTKIVRTDKIRAWGWNEENGASCKSR
jgi:hypothetical protein